MSLSNVLPNRVVASYIFDYVIIVIFIIAFSALDKAEPFHQHFSLENKSLQYPMARPERVAPWLAALVACAFPLAVIIVWTLFLDGMFSHHKSSPVRRSSFEGRSKIGIYTIRDRLWEMNAGILGLGLSVAAAITITGALKNLTGKPRPDVIDRCKPDPDWKELSVGLTSWKQCTGDEIEIRDGFKSWPSGHSSTAFAGLGYLSIYIGGKLHVLDNRGEVWKTILVMIPLIAAAMIAISRIMDARHHPFDVLSSSLLGLFVAWLAYRQYFPSLSDTSNKGRAYPIRSWGREPPPPNHLLAPEDMRGIDEEEGKLGYSQRGLASGSGGLPPMAASGAGADLAAQRRRQYLEEQEFLEHRRQKAHEFYGGVTDGGPNHPQTAYLPGAHASSASGGAAVGGPYPEDSNSEGEGYEMSTRRLTKDAPQNTAYRAYSPQPSPADYKSPRRGDTISTTDSHDSEDRRMGIAAATNALGGERSGSTFSPIHEGRTTGGADAARRGTTASSDDGFVQVGKGSPPRGVELRDGQPMRI